MLHVLEEADKLVLLRTVGRAAGRLDVRHLLAGSESKVSSSNSKASVTNLRRECPGCVV
jgi:hypothetical protein